MSTVTDLYVYVDLCVPHTHTDCSMSLCSHNKYRLLLYLLRVSVSVTPSVAKVNRCALSFSHIHLNTQLEKRKGNQW